MYILDPYDFALEQILKTGIRSLNRTGVDTVALAGISARYRIDEYFPIITRRKLWPKAIFAEMLWFLSGSSNNNNLQALGANIWTPWVSDKFEREHGFVPGSFGSTYGFQMRYFGGYYGTGDESHPNYGKRGFDQISWIVNEIKTNPDSRRILFSLWNPQQMHEMRLPPCCFAFQVLIKENKMTGILTQRSGDFFVGCCANVLEYSALLYMLGQQTGYEPYELVHTVGDAHIYLDQVPMVEEYLSRDKPNSPKLKLNKAKDIFSYRLDDFELIDYNPLAAIKTPVAV